ncbi:M23 family metallopeptidase [Acetonema longum]|uniref:Peptidase M23 n=1 Tax=Acetonema longum DSM 6540 TaxID=1009370 RepID=F7NIG0_9FIRM|nr:M23 family metallopeptidase [Acetonema longum]EGO64190.1 Peptidase M23 [Acetonema longum DSM 6540]
MSRDKQAGKFAKPDNREYTLMLVPHQGEAVVKIRIPVKAIKYSVATVCVVTILMTGAIINYRHTVKTANADKSELKHLREVNSSQNEQIEQLAGKTAKLQQDMTRLNVLDSEIRKILNSDELKASRSGVTRPNLPGHDGQGGPVIQAQTSVIGSASDTLQDVANVREKILNSDELKASRSGAIRPTSSGHDGQGGPAIHAQASEIGSALDTLQNVAEMREKSLAELKLALIELNAQLAVTPSIWPNDDGVVTSRFGWRQSPWGMGSDFHPGIDIANDYGSPVVAAADGEVIYSGWIGGYGKAVEIRHGHGINTIYGHNSELAVSVGQYVKKGQLIAYMGSTGNSTGPHVHYEVRVNDTAVNPANFL